MSAGASMHPFRNRVVLAAAVVVVVALAVTSVVVVRNRRAETTRQEAERAEQVALEQREAATRILAEAERERDEQRERERIERQEREEEELRAEAARAEEERNQAEAERVREERRRKAEEEALRERERATAEEERLEREARIATAALAAEEEARRVAEAQERREAEERARREEEERKKAAEEEARIAAEAAATAAVPEEEEEDTPDVETETTIDEVLRKRGWRVAGDLRPILDGLHEEARDGSTDSDIAPGLRARLGASFGVTKRIRLGTRLAVTGFAGDFNPNFVRPGDVQDASELEGGEATFDELYLHWKRVDRFDLAFGRIQTRFVLRGGVYAKSLDRNNSNNWRVNWTDGLQATLHTGGWTTNFIWEYKSSNGPGSIRRDPLDFDDDGARNTWFVGFENLEQRGVIVQRAFDVSYLPDSLLKDGTPDGRRTDYWGMVGRLMVRWPPETEGLALLAGTEVGYSPETPTSIAKGIGDGGDADGLAWNIVASAMDFVENHSIGINYARTGAGWLLSPQYRPNEELSEIRYMWRPERLPLFETRIRRRQELNQLVDTVQKRTQYDFFIRLTWRFTLVDN